MMPSGLMTLFARKALFFNNMIRNVGKLMHSSIQSRFAPILYVLIFFAGFLAAQVWFNQQAYLANLPLLVTAISAVALVWLIWAVVSARSKAKSKMLHREQLIQKRAFIRFCMRRCSVLTVKRIYWFWLSAIAVRAWRRMCALRQSLCRITCRASWLPMQ